MLQSQLVSTRINRSLYYKFRRTFKHNINHQLIINYKPINYQVNIEKNSNHDSSKFCAYQNK